MSLTPIFAFSRRNVHCASHSPSNAQDHDHFSRRHAFFGAAVATIGTAISLPAYAETSVIDGQGQTRVLPLTAEEDLTIPERQVLEYNKRTQRQNSAPPDFPLFVREGFDMTVLTPEGYQVSPEGIIYKDYAEGVGNLPEEGQQVTFDYTAYNESAAVIDSSYRKGQPAQTRIGIQGLIPGFEMGIRTMKPGGKRRIVVPPELGPPVGPSTFFSAKQFEVFDVELRAAKTCVRRTVGMFSDVVCE
jgi:FKBP-type peptidyl-prolyl cis-trans isomerase